VNVHAWSIRGQTIGGYVGRWRAQGAWVAPTRPEGASARLGRLWRFVVTSSTVRPFRFILDDAEQADDDERCKRKSDKESAS